MTNVKFNATERKQINLRFDTLYKVVTAKTWTHGTMGVMPLGDDGGETHYEQEELREMGKQGKACPPDGLKMCLAGAAAWVNGPTEEQIAALLATQIIIDKAPKVLNHVMVYMEKYPKDYEMSAPTKSEAILALYEQLMKNPEDQPFDGEVEMNGYGDGSVSVIVCFNDAPNRKLSEVHAMIKKAQALYDKLAKVKAVEDKWAKMTKLRNADFEKLNSLFSAPQKAKPSRKRR